MKSSQMETMTFGQRLTGVNFNPSQDPQVDRVKQLCAELADIVKSDGNGNTDREKDQLYTLIRDQALGEVLNAQMNVVKLLTLNK